MRDNHDQTRIDMTDKSQTRKDLPRRESHRLVDFDYTQRGAYFITICTNDRGCHFGEVKDGRMLHSALGVLVERELLLVPVRRRPWIRLGCHVVMPNHVHAVILNDRADRYVHRRVRGGRGAQEARDIDAQMPAEQPLQPEYRPCRDIRGAGAGDASVAPTLESLSIGAIVGGFKAGVTREARRLGLWGDATLWQREFYDHVIRCQAASERISHYIAQNPARWTLDRENADRTGDDEFERWLEAEGRKPLP